jgi:hypothetical protein
VVAETKAGFGGVHMAHVARRLWQAAFSVDEAEAATLISAELPMATGRSGAAGGEGVCRVSNGS